MDTSCLFKQEGDQPPVPFSFFNEQRGIEVRDDRVPDSLMKVMERSYKTVKQARNCTMGKSVSSRSGGRGSPGREDLGVSMTTIYAYETVKQSLLRILISLSL